MRRLLLRWAMSSLTLKGKPSEQISLASNASVPVSSATSTASSVAEGGESISINVSTSSDIADQPAPLSNTSTDGWGELENGIQEDHESDKDGWDDTEPLDEPQPSLALANIQAAQKRPVAQPKSQVASLRPKNAVKTVKEEDDDLWGSIAAPPPKSTSKPLIAKTSVSVDNDDPWAAIAAPPPTTTVKRLSAEQGRGRGAKPTVPRLGAQRIIQTTSSGI